MGPRLLGQLRAGFSVDFRLLGGRPNERGGNLPEPPETVETGPNIAAPSADSSWLPGCWVWRQNRYAWRPGFRATVQPNWVWIPDHYMWAPRGYVFVDGYWDRPIDRRGVLFAPVQFNASVYSRPGFSYSPTTVIDLSVFTNHLCARATNTTTSATTTPPTIRPPGSSPGSPTNPATGATIRFTCTSGGSFGRTTDGSSANGLTSKTAAITRICDRRTPWRPRDC